MFCKMDVEDEFLRHSRAWRRRTCRCAALPARPRESYGCRCSRCGSVCRQCPGYGYPEPPARRYHQILTYIRSRIRRRLRVHGYPPGFVRVIPEDAAALTRKRDAEAEEHWIREYVDPGPPLRVFDVLVVEDVRRDRRDEHE